MECIGSYFHTRGFLRWLRCGLDDSVFCCTDFFDFGWFWFFFFDGGGVGGEALLVTRALVRRAGVDGDAEVSDADELLAGDWWRRFRLK